MQSDKMLNIINTLQTYRHRMSDNHIPSLFEDTGTINTAEYWLASDLCNIIPNLPLNMTENIPEQIYSLANKTQIHEILAQKNTGQTLSQVVHQGSVTVPHPKNTRRASAAARYEDAKLNRFACFTLSYNAPMSPTTHLTMAYFMSPGATPTQILQTTADIERATERMRCTSLEKTMCAILAASTTTPIGVVYNKIHNIFMGANTAENLRATYNIKDTSPLTNYMLTDALRTRNIAIQRAIARFNHTQRHNQHTFTNILTEEIAQGRTALIRKTGRAPESYITPLHIQKCTKALTDMRLKFIRDYILDNVSSK